MMKLLSFMVKVYLNYFINFFLDPIRTRQGQLSFRAFRLSKKALELSLNTDWSAES